MFIPGVPVKSHRPNATEVRFRGSLALLRPITAGCWREHMQLASVIGKPLVYIFSNPQKPDGLAWGQQFADPGVLSSTHGCGSFFQGSNSHFS
jgi:hypothetical protein